MDNAKIQDLAKSSKGNKWELCEDNPVQSRALMQKFALPEIVARILSSRAMEVESAAEFFEPSLKESLPDPSHLLDMDKAVERIYRAILANEKIVIFGDYDVDGATSTALLMRFFRGVGIEAGYYIPDRMKEGYGPSIAGFEKIKQGGADLVITVDCGTLAFEAIEFGNKIKLDTIVIDHHLGIEKLPDAVAIVNPNRIDESSQYTNLAAVGVSFLLAVAINKKLREEGFYEGKSEPKLLSLLDLVALGTVCDVMTITGLNRVFVAQGLKVIAARRNCGIVALCDIANLEEAPTTYHLGFVIGPRINAGGRIGKSDLGTRILATENIDEAFEISLELDRLNKERRAIETMALEEAMAQAELQKDKNEMIFAISNEKTSKWHEGIIGIIAGRIKEQFSKPCAVITFTDGIGKASARSVSRVDLGAAVTSAKMQNLLISGGGHSMAAGFSIAQEKLEEFRDFMNKRLSADIAQYSENKTLKIDAVIDALGITKYLFDSFQRLAPFGNGNPEPRFMVSSALITGVRQIGQDHLMCFIGSDTSKRKIKAVAFRCLETQLGKDLMASNGKFIDLAGKVKINKWQGQERVEFIIDDIMPA